MAEQSETAVADNCRECGELAAPDVCEDCRVCFYCCHRNPQRHETAVAARVLRERLPKLTPEDMGVLAITFGQARYLCGFEPEDIENIVLTLFPDAHQEATDG